MPSEFICLDVIEVGLQMLLNHKSNPLKFQMLMKRFHI